MAGFSGQFLSTIAKAQLLDAGDRPVSHEDPEKFGKAVHLKDIHLEKGMHCVDCHFEQDNHGNGKLYGETRNAVEIDCVDCHGTIQQTSHADHIGSGSPQRRHEPGCTPVRPGRSDVSSGEKIVCISARCSTKTRLGKWCQVLDTITPGSEHYSEKSRLAKTVQKDGQTWGVAVDESKLAHQNSRMTCYACHSSWAPTCYGCHLSMTANQRTPMLHNEGVTTRNWTSYNFQVLRDDIYTLGIDGTVTGHRVAPVRFGLCRACEFAE